MQGKDNIMYSHIEKKIGKVTLKLSVLNNKLQQLAKTIENIAAFLKMGDNKSHPPPNEVGNKTLLYISLLSLVTIWRLVNVDCIWILVIHLLHVPQHVFLRYDAKQSSV